MTEIEADFVSDLFPSSVGLATKGVPPFLHLILRPAMESATEKFVPQAEFGHRIEIGTANLSGRERVTVGLIGMCDYSLRQIKR